MKAIVAKALFDSHTYPEYRKLIADLLTENKTTGNDQSAELTHYSSLNNTRMNRLDKTISLLETVSLALKKIKKEYIWLVLSEGWCGDAAQILPVLNKMALETNAIDFRIVLRDENESLMNGFLTNGAKAIPKLVLIDKATGSVIGDWGPRPKAAIQLMLDYTLRNGVIDQKIKEELQMWYFHDKGIAIQNEILELMMNVER
ncbi:thioredoxin family protein [Flavobacterium restrictum]|uniref:Thioredoxin family protein n=1 Tax=Flavobacterium restrictum TaxID=2594428 RepID=A0A553DYL9_9FLAO|nr:thioredoxin family protein [Flavobacterium restrictum]TRX37743.1 thioredoxin family protein [Flavobacterium restrictum]